MDLKPAITTLIMASALATAAAGVPIGADSISVARADGRLMVDFRLVLDSLKVGADRQLYVTPLITDGAGNMEYFPDVLINGRDMHYAMERGTIKAAVTGHADVRETVRRRNGKPQRVAYTASMPFQTWMMGSGTRLAFVVDTCGCGRPLGKDEIPGIPLDLNPAPEMLTTIYEEPQRKEAPEIIHEGRARVQFEVDRTELHDKPYRARNGQLIDNRAELQVIDDSITYALSDPNVELSEVEIIGYASPESPYLHNQDLATGRSRALAEYIGRKYRLPEGRATYDAVAENWGEFRDMVEKSEAITEQQRKDLLELIDEPTYGPSDFDAKERRLKTDPKFAKLYKELILPEWFPVLRATVFRIKTRLRPMSDRQLAKVMHTSPEKMSHSQFFDVGKLYEEGTPEFNETIDKALEQYPDEPTANLNAAIKAVKEGKIDLAEQLLRKAGDSPAAENTRGIVATYRGKEAEAARHFEQSGTPEARHNLELLGRGKAATE